MKIDTSTLIRFLNNDLSTAQMQEIRVLIEKNSKVKLRFEEIKSVLAEDGIVAANTFSSSKLYEHESATYHAVFGDFINVTANNNSNRIILAGYSNSPTEQQIAQRVTQLAPLLAPYDVDIKAISQRMFFTKDGKDSPSDTKVLTDQYSPANLLNF